MSEAERVERIKLTANALDRASTACLTVGFFAPAATAWFAPSQPLAAFEHMATGCVIWIVGAYALHYAARGALKEL
jgi:hypothetical protein